MTHQPNQYLIPVIGNFPGNLGRGEDPRYSIFDKSPINH